ncbi:putative lipocalin family protein [Vibrio phage 381E49-1]|nr:putative lipocalin family protein [Vibrio phage 381E49-1]
MKTYNSYEEAKIANPECEIYLDYSVFRTWRSDQIKSGTKCNPADHCMTVEKFLADGHKFVEGDVIFNTYPSPTVDFISNSHLDNYNELDKDDDKRFILLAAALKPRDNDYAMSVMEKKVRVEYEQLGFHKCHEAMFKHEMEEKLYRTSHDGFVIASMNDIADNWQSELYRRIETEIDERQEFIDKYFELARGTDLMAADKWAGAIYDNLVNPLISPIK